MELQSIDFADDDRIHVNTDGYSVVIIRTDEGLVVDIWDGNDPDADAPVASTYVFDNDMKGALQ
jgi:hypothetical protein